VTRPVHIVIPIYRDVPLTQRCLESLVESGLPEDCRITLIDDASPDPGMFEMLVSFSQRVGCAALRNSTNLGFVVSANLGMARYPDHDIVLLNNDTEVPYNWLQRLSSAAYRSSNTGTATPFSNAGSLASYPLPNKENLLPHDISLSQLDSYFKLANAGVCIDIPTGVGFCLFIRWDCLKETGQFDADLFGRGYGEENDFCLRASARGWKHVLAADCFVYHRGRGSFEKSERIKHAYMILVHHHPNYPALLQQHFSTDPARVCRMRVDALRLVHHVNTPLINIDPVTTSSPSPCVPLLNLSISRPGLLKLHWANAGEGFRLWFSLPEDTDDLLTLLSTFNICNADSLIRHNLTSSYIQRTQKNVCQRIGQTELLNLITRHSEPRLTLMQSLIRMLARLGLRVSGMRVLRPLVARVPVATRARLRQWLRSSSA
jgi:GT2 family glycosyltransferase